MPVIPASAGIQVFCECRYLDPAFAGMTNHYFSWNYAVST
jgi:hypothetical protein